MLNYNRIREHFQECEIERLQKRVHQLEEELEAAKTNSEKTASTAQPERKPLNPTAPVSDTRTP